MEKDKILRVRISSTQLKRLISTVMKNKLPSVSEFVRNAIVDKIEKINSNEKEKI